MFGNNVNNLLDAAVDLQSKALELMENPASTAEDIQKAEKMIADAQDMVSRQERIDTLKSQLVGKTQVGMNQENPANNTKFNHFGEFLTAIASSKRGVTDKRLNYFESDAIGITGKALAESVGSTGGYLVPTEFRAELLQVASEMSIIRPRAMVIPMTRRQIEVPALAQDDTTAGQPHWFGGMIAYWEAENATISETEAKFRSITLTAHDLTAVTHASNNLLSDSAISLSAFLTGQRGFPGVIAWKEDYAFFNGSGAGEPLGILNSGAALGVTRTTSSTVKFADLANMMGSFMPSSRGLWVASISLRATLLQLADTAGYYIWGSAKDGVPDSLMGMPIVFTEKLPAKGSKGDIMLIDPSHYYVGDRQATTIDTTDQLNWLKNQTSWKVTHRVDGKPWLAAPFTLADGTTQISPFVVLNA